MKSKRNFGMSLYLFLRSSLVCFVQFIKHYSFEDQYTDPIISDYLN